MPNRPSAPEGHLSVGHPIAVVAERTGLSRDVLRVWERRYGAVEPVRTPGGQRLYSDQQVRRFRLLASATRHGRNISVVARMTDDELERLAAEDESERLPPLAQRPPDDSLVETSVAHARALDAVSFDRELRRAMARDGVPIFLDLIAPRVMQRIGEEWHAGRLSIPHEHLASAALLAIILDAMRSVPREPDASQLLVATPSGERHAIGAAAVGAAAALDGWGVTYLGADVPASDIATAAAECGAHAVALSIVRAEDPTEIARNLRAVRARLPALVPLIVGGSGAMRVAENLEIPGISFCGTIAELQTLLARESVAG